MYRSMGDMLTQQSASPARAAAPMMMALTTTTPRASAQSVSMDVKLPAIPACLDAEWLKARAYCAENPGGGADPILNTACAAARKQPGYYPQLLSTPPCGGGAMPDPSFTPPGPDGSEMKTDENGEPNYVLWGGLALLVVALGGGVYYYSKKK